MLDMLTDQLAYRKSDQMGQKINIQTNQPNDWLIETHQYNLKMFKNM